MPTNRIGIECALRNFSDDFSFITHGKERIAEYFGVFPLGLVTWLKDAGAEVLVYSSRGSESSTVVRY